ncbi:BatD family protein [Flavobacterium sp. RHBU_3]|uniref:BatD family protein n=1 Tax=Flavobacterium sp. RHBU_3 TaxID=3391184 RepID=UPI0039846C1A
MKKYLILLFLLALQGLYAQVEFKATPSRSKIGVNEHVRVEFTMNQDGDNFVPPSFQGFKVSGPGQSINNSWVNGKHTFSKSYNYLLTPTAKGTFTIGSATIEIAGVEYKTTPFKITVGNAVAEPDPDQQAPQYNPFNPFDPFGRRQQQQQQQQNINIDPKDEVHLVAEVQNTNPYVNEPVNVVYKLYIGGNVGNISWQEKTTPKYNDFWSQVDLLKGEKIQLKEGTYKGKPAHYIVVRKAVLYPQKSGKLLLEPLIDEIGAEIVAGRPDFFGRVQMKETKMTVSTGKQYINVRALPEAGKPADFAGAVGKFDFKVTPDKTTSKNGESIKLTVSVNGKGNLKLFSLPKPEVPAALEMYDPEHKEDVQTPLTGMTGSISDVYTIVPNNKGKYPIKAMTFSWFDPATGKYYSKTSDEIMIDVLSVPEGTVASNKAQGGKQKVAAGETFRYIATQTTLRAQTNEDFYGSTLFYVLLAAPFAFIPVIVLARKKKEAYDSDVEGSKIRNNNKLAKKYLTAARKELGNKEPFYLALEKALHNFLKAKLRIETAELSRDNIRELLLSRNANPDTVDAFSRIMDSCEFARYAPSSDTAMNQDYESAVSVITSLAKQVS